MKILIAACEQFWLLQCREEIAENPRSLRICWAIAVQRRKWQMADGRWQTGFDQEICSNCVDFTDSIATDAEENRDGKCCRREILPELHDLAR
jgi:hypothetical protein